MLFLIKNKIVKFKIILFSIIKNKNYYYIFIMINLYSLFSTLILCIIFSIIGFTKSIVPIKVHSFKHILVI